MSTPRDDTLTEVVFYPAVTLLVAPDGSVRFGWIDWTQSLSNGWDRAVQTQLYESDPRCEAAAEWLDERVARFDWGMSR